jgi:hypothetical protein
MRYRFLLLVAMVVSGACGDSPTAPSTPASTAASGQPFKMSGQGSATFELPAGVTRVHIVATSAENSCHNFLVYVGQQRLLVSTILGTCTAASGRTYDATHDVAWARVDIRGGSPPDHNLTPLVWTVEGF